MITKNGILSELLIAFEILSKKWFFHNDQKKGHFARYAASWPDTDKKQFYNNDHKNVLLPALLIVFQILPKNHFFKVISKKVTKKLFFKVISKKLPFPRNVDIFVYLGKKQLLRSELEKTPFSSKWWYLRIYGQIG